MLVHLVEIDFATLLVSNENVLRLLKLRYLTVLLIELKLSDLIILEQTKH